MRFNKLILTGDKKHIPRGSKDNAFFAGHQKVNSCCGNMRRQGIRIRRSNCWTLFKTRGKLNGWNRWNQWISHFWRLLKRLDGGGKQNQGTSMDPDRIAKSIVQRDAHVINHRFETDIRKNTKGSSIAIRITVIYLLPSRWLSKQ